MDLNTIIIVISGIVLLVCLLLRGRSKVNKTLIEEAKMRSERRFQERKHSDNIETQW